MDAAGNRRGNAVSCHRFVTTESHLQDIGFFLHQLANRFTAEFPDLREILNAEMLLKRGVNAPRSIGFSEVIGQQRRRKRGALQALQAVVSLASPRLTRHNTIAWRSRSHREAGGFMARRHTLGTALVRGWRRAEFHLSKRESPRSRSETLQAIVSKGGDPYIKWSCSDAMSRFKMRRSRAACCSDSRSAAAAAHPSRKRSDTRARLSGRPPSGV